MFHRVVVVLVIAVLATACGAADEPRSQRRSQPTTTAAKIVPIEDQDGQLQVNGHRYYNACNVLYGHGLAAALKTRYTASVEVQETFAEAGRSGASSDLGLPSMCTVRQLGRGDITVEFDVRHWSDAGEAKVLHGKTTNAGEPLGWAADAAVVVDEGNQRVAYYGIIGAATIAITVLANLDESEPRVALGAVRAQVEPSLKAMFAEAAKVDSHSKPLSGAEYGQARLVDPCGVLNASAAEAVFARDEHLSGEAKALDATDVLRRYRPNGGAVKPGDQLEASCTRTSLDLDGQGVAFVNITFHPTVKEATEDFQASSEGKQKVAGLNVPAYLDSMGGPQKVLRFQKGPYVVRTGITWVQGRGGESVYAQTPAELIPLAKVLVQNLP